MSIDFTSLGKDLSRQVKSQLDALGAELQADVEPILWKLADDVVLFGKKFAEGQDVHKATASEVFGLAPEEVGWKVVSVVLPPAAHLTEAELEATLRGSEEGPKIVAAAQRAFRRGFAALELHALLGVPGESPADRAAIGIGDGVQFGVHAALGSANQAAPLVVRPPFFDHRLVAVRCALR